ncbi:MAG: FAD:protein FMN transferase [Acholeplasmataceae bacterium]|nr:FAD:protein FMN transferase [Acholeplasmataceae bacterium]
MKKILTAIILAVLILSTVACKDTRDEPEGTMFSLSLFQYMDTFVSVSFMASDDDQAATIKSEIEAIYQTYHELSTSYEALPSDSRFMTNIYEINTRPNQAIQIDKELYDLLVEAEALRIATDGYFNVAIGNVVDAWKSGILGEDGYLFEAIPEDVFLATKANALSYSIPETAFLLDENDGTYTITVLDEDVKIDLGAISKGYATERVKDYLVGLDIAYFSISAGSSSIALGGNKNRLDEGGVFHVSLANPIRTSAADGTYGMIKVKDISVTTSGDYEQYALYEGERYHHIVSPISFEPEQYYHTVTLIGEDAGLLDALSTALFSMAPALFETWVETHAEDYGIEVIRFNNDGTVTTFLTDTDFEDIR